MEPEATGLPHRLCAYTAGFFRPGVRRILQLAGHEVRLGLPKAGDGVAVWGKGAYAWRGEKIAARYQAPLIRIEDAFLRSLRPGRSGEAPMGLMLDDLGIHYDASTPSRLEQILARDPLDNSNILSQARDGIERLRLLDLSKYNIHDPEADLPPPGYVLVIDQTRGDASVPDPARFTEMLATAQAEHPGQRILIKTHPETQSGFRPGHFQAGDLVTAPVSPWRLLEGAIAVYTVSSQLGFEAILAGHRPVVFGQPFYAGWGLTDDRFPLDRRTRRLTKVQLFAGAMVLAPVWATPCHDRLCSLEEVIDQLEAETRAFRADRLGYVAGGMRLWKRKPLQDFFGREKPLIFRKTPGEALTLAAKTGRKPLIWAGKSSDGIAVEDGFLRSRGLGAALVPPLSLVTDTTGIYYDPTRPSDFETLVRRPLPPGGQARAERLRRALIAARLSKYNLGGGMPDLPEGHRILVPGQVEDDASIRLGCGEISSNLGLLQAVRAAVPGAVIVYKPHPDVEAGLRPGALPPEVLTAPWTPPVDPSDALPRPQPSRPLVDVIATQADPIALIDACDEVWTLTSLLGFEALIRGKPVTTIGAPFYAGWGLTTDLGPVPDRRRRAPDLHPLPKVTLDQLVHASLIAYPRYFDPVAKRPCPPEVALRRLGQSLPAPLRLRILSKLQGALASYAWLWR
ncbi:capsular polysaccharide biosynthesis protein [Stagnihabitans tardus]|uniref:Capsular polysaccharide biosynthesis protein n=1 Tax=Stagnihabitans tardus TaxID=2699202 RepID=A0AAE4Y8I7_9RHOB|nr:capsular polysaccharide biosynthesis protein [Stagnihabitans tardus]NBZ87137.1 capsular polysaccharide biosynthesis protein [Stagnihabitans tardus]